MEQPVGGELYRLTDDLGEQRNVAVEHPDVVAKMTQQLQTLQQQGRSRP